MGRSGAGAAGICPGDKGTGAAGAEGKRASKGRGIEPDFGCSRTKTPQTKPKGSNRMEASEGEGAARDGFD